MEAQLLPPYAITDMGQSQFGCVHTCFRFINIIQFKVSTTLQWYLNCCLNIARWRWLSCHLPSWTGPDHSNIFDHGESEFWNNFPETLATFQDQHDPARLCHKNTLHTDTVPRWSKCIRFGWTKTRFPDHNLYPGHPSSFLAIGLDLESVFEPHCILVAHSPFLTKHPMHETRRQSLTHKRRTWSHIIDRRNGRKQGFNWRYSKGINIVSIIICCFF